MGLPKTKKIIFDTAPYANTKKEQTHFYDDYLAALKAFHHHKIPSCAHAKTIALAKKHNDEVTKNGFEDVIVLKVGSDNISAKYFGEGHTKGNSIGYCPSEDIMFGGCLIKEIGANKGYLGNANVSNWPNTVEKVKKEYRIEHLDNKIPMVYAIVAQKKN